MKTSNNNILTKPLRKIEQEEHLLSYVNLVNRICTRIAQEQGDENFFDEVSLSDVP